MRTSQPFRVVVGRVLGSYQGTHDYDVTTDFGRFTGIYHGISRGFGGVQENGGILPGTFVFVAFAEGERFCFILGPFMPLWGVDAADPSQLLVYPQVSGFELDKRISGQLYNQNIYGMQNRPTGLANDMVDGEWSMTSPFGPGFAVELFRAGVRGGPMSGLWCYGDTQLTRLLGLDFEFATLADAEYQHRHGNSMVRSRSRVWYPSEAVQDLQPRDIEITGAIHAGRQRFLAPAAARGVARPALFQEAVDTNGFLTVTSAAGVVIQRYLGVVTPEESQAPAPANPALLAEQPLDADAVRNKVLTTPVPPVTPANDTNGMTWAQRALDLVTSETSVRGRGGFDRLPLQWPNAGQPPGVPEDCTHTSYDASMWRAAPAAVSLTLDAIEAPKKFYVGRSMVALLPDGSVLIEDASHSQILMSGGNIMLSAPHDIILAPGRNLTAIVGNDASVRASRNLDLATNEGRVSIKAEDQLALLGGNNGVGGVLLESRGGATWKAGTGSAQGLGGVLIKSATGLFAQAATVGFYATAQLIARADGVIEFSSNEIAAKTPSLIVYSIADGTTPSYAFTQDAAIMPGGLVVRGQLEALNSAFFDGDIIAVGSVDAGGSVIGSSVGPGGEAAKRAVDTAAAAVRRQVNAALLSGAKNAQTVNNLLNAQLNGKTPMNKAVVATLGFSFSTSKQLRTDTDGAFALPETRWQVMSRRADFGGSRQWVEAAVKSPAGDDALTAAAPGYEAWRATAYQLDETDLYLDITDGSVKPQTDGGEKLPDPTVVAIDGNYLIGD